MNKKERFNKVVRDIKTIKIQGAKNIAKNALYAYSLIPTKGSKKELLSSRPTEPMMHKVLDLADKWPTKKIQEHFDDSQNKINQSVFKIIKDGDIIFTHCHSTSVVNSLIYSKKHGKKFQVYNTETRPLFQGRKTSKELRKAGIKVTMFIDSAMAIAIEKENPKDKIHVDKILLGADVLLKKGIINKIGSGLISEIANNHKVPLYIIADSWKFTKSKIPLEQRKLNEIWDKAPKRIKIVNPAFEFIPKKYITKIISEYGILSYNEFLNRV
jgi:translation initiation factor 2B subunit (eIF-2B alpha/beta/delta family)